ncbi:hypothetical protein [Pararhizobium sp. DWP1-1-3]|uniref:hypothetical protein n=1 Tax=Pararhizobium sp. DWP1-1-3 TaxID=2804652 RepID=UPI003CEE52B9
MMNVRPGRVPSSRRGGKGGPPQSSQPLTYPAPKGGLVTTRDMAADTPGSASILLNMLPTLMGCRVRGGSVKKGLAAGGGTLRSAFKYKYGGIERLFMATDTAIFEMSSPAAPPTTTAASVSGMTSSDWSTFQHATAAGAFLVCVNGSDPRQMFNGTTWVTTPAMTFADGSTESQMNYGWIFKNREWYLKNGTLDAYYLPTNQIGGAAVVFPLGGVLKKGGSLLTAFSWSIESGDGLSDMCVFVSTEGEVAVYMGSDPATDFALKGIYQIGKPVGKNAWIRAGADILVANTDGLTPMSQVFTRDREALSLVSVSRPIEDEWRLAANSTGGRWNLTQWIEQNLVFISFPENSVISDKTFVLNVLTGKWSFISNWRAVCYASYQGSLFFGSIDGYCWQADTTGSDDGLVFQAVYLSQFTASGAYGQRKTATLAQMYFRGKTKPKVKLFARADFDITAPASANVSIGNSLSSEWNNGLWDVATWDGVSSSTRYKYRQNVRATGDHLAVGCVIASGGDVRLDVEIDLANLQTEVGQASA